MDSQKLEKLKKRAEEYKKLKAEFYQLDVDDNDQIDRYVNIFQQINDEFIDLMGDISTWQSNGKNSISSSSMGFADGKGHQDWKNKLNNIMASIENTITYSLDWDKQNPDIGVASCASTVFWCYKHFFMDINRNEEFVNGSIIMGSGNWQRDGKEFSVVWSRGGSGITDEEAKNLQIGDVLLFRWDESEALAMMDHTEMYAGEKNGEMKTWSHGGPGTGPNLKNLNKACLRRVIRWEGMNEPENSDTYTWDGDKLTPTAGRIQGPSGEETYYDLDMTWVIQTMRRMGFSESEYPFWIREDGCKMLGKYIMVAANLELRKRGSTIPCSLGMGLVCDTGGFAASNPTQLDIATNWVNHGNI